MSLTYKEVAEILRIIDASNLDELVIEIEGARIHVRRNGSGQATPLPPPGASASHEFDSRVGGTCGQGIGRHASKS